MPYMIKCMAKLVLNAYLKKQGITKYRFAKMMGLEPSNAHRYFKPDYDPKLSTLTKWAKLLGCKVADLLRE